jgi:hypothetical protein
MGPLDDARLTFDKTINGFYEPGPSCEFLPRGCGSPLIARATRKLQMKNKNSILDVRRNNKAVAEVSGYVLGARLTA